tara:strand:- start:252 stop:458 length:207 start_codon:yes stop_codon:yes gene_type:complete
LLAGADLPSSDALMIQGETMKLKLPTEFLVQNDYSLTALIDFTAKAIKKKDESFSKVQKRVRARVRDH